MKKRHLLILMYVNQMWKDKYGINEYGINKYLIIRINKLNFSADGIEPSTIR
jgi:hypothetical protein